MFSSENWREIWPFHHDVLISYADNAAGITFLIHYTDESFFSHSVEMVIFAQEMSLK